MVDEKKVKVTNVPPDALVIVIISNKSSMHSGNWIPPHELAGLSGVG